MRRIYSRNIKKQAVSALAEQQVDYRKLVFRHAAVSSAFLLVISLIGLLVDSAMMNTQGLDGIGKAGMLKSMYTVCMLAGNILLPFWEMGILYTSIRVMRRQNIRFSMLTQGFRHFAPLTGYYAMFALILFGIAMACFNILIIPFMCLPVPEELQTAMLSLDYANAAQIEEFYAANFQDLMMYSLPFTVTYGCVFGLIVVLISYRFRMCSYLLLEDNRAGVMASFGMSSRMTKGERKNLFLLDLSFWWYHLLTVLITLLIYVPDILLATGVIVPENYEMISFIAYLGYLACYLILTGLAGAYYQTSMACAYQTLRNSADENTL